MAPFIPRFHLFEIDDQPWFPRFLRARVQDSLLETWVSSIPYVQPSSPARIAATLLHRHLGPARASSYTYVDFCAGSGGPTPSIERSLNRRLRAASLPEADFVLTDLHPNPEAWSRAAARSHHIRYESKSVDAAAADTSLLARLARPSLHQNLIRGSSSSTPTPNSKRAQQQEQRQRRDGTGQRQQQQQQQGEPITKIFRLFNLAFHHFDDPLARAILDNTLDTSDGFAIFELQGRDVHSFFACLLLGIGCFFVAPYHAWKWRSWATLVFTYLLPILPFVLMFDGWVSSLRTRTPDEVEKLMRSCESYDADHWEVKSGSECHLWPVAYLNWVIVTKKTGEEQAS